MTQQTTNLVDKCLIATPAIKDPIFASSIVYMCEHSEQGSMGLVVNHCASQVLQDVFAQLDILCEDDEIRSQPVYIGGPVQLEQGFVLHSAGRRWESSIDVSPNIQLTSSLDILEDIANHKGPRDYLVILGFSGWGSGQLETELHQNAWLTSSASGELLFHQNSEAKWQMAFDTLGFDLNNLSPISGNA